MESSPVTELNVPVSVPPETRRYRPWVGSKDAPLRSSPLVPVRLTVPVAVIRADVWLNVGLSRSVPPAPVKASRAIVSVKVPESSVPPDMWTGVEFESTLLAPKASVPPDTVVVPV